MQPGCRRQLNTDHRAAGWPFRAAQPQRTRDRCKSLDGKTVTHKTKGEHCPGSGHQPDDDAPLACWLPVKDGLTPHGLRHSHKTWMAEDGIPEILAEQRLGHDVPGMRGLYAHVSPFRADQKTISQIPPRTPTAPILSVG